MFAVVGAAGKIGYSTSLALREAGVPVRAVLRDEAKASRLVAIGCEVALADLQDPVALGQAISDADAVQIILPPPPQAPDTIGEMRRSIESLAEALARARTKRVLAISDYGAHVGEGVGMPSLFHAFEERLRRLEMPKVFLRSAEHMEGWAAFVPVVIATGILPSLHHPIDKEFPTVSAADVGLIAAKLLLGARAGDDNQVIHAEGPRRYSAIDVAAALSKLTGLRVTAQALPRSDWQGSLQRVLSASAAKLLVEVYDAHNQGGLIEAEPGGLVRYGRTELIDALRPFVAAAASTN
jgi:uncharacterized protein YbjT (DUF2867 family)